MFNEVESEVAPSNFGELSISSIAVAVCVIIVSHRHNAVQDHLAYEVGFPPLR